MSNFTSMLTMNLANTSSVECFLLWVVNTETGIREDIIVVVTLAGPDHPVRNLGGFSTLDYVKHYIDCLDVFAHYSQNLLAP